MFTKYNAQFGIAQAEFDLYGSNLSEVLETVKDMVKKNIPHAKISRDEIFFTMLYKNSYARFRMMVFEYGHGEIFVDVSGWDHLPSSIANIILALYNSCKTVQR